LDKPQRKIIHIDMDAFYASVEQRDDPSLRGLAIAVGGGEKRGVITTASYEARKFGVRSAMSGYEAKRLCPQLIFVPIRFDAYKEASQAIRSIFARYTDLIEPLSFDEAFLDVTENKINEPIATEIAKEIKQAIFNETQLTASAGISYCKFLAKVASDINKPDGITIITPKKAIAFLEQLEIEKFYGIGKVTAKKMKAMGIFHGRDLKKMDRISMVSKFGKMGSYYYDIVRGIDDRPVQSHRERKSLAIERTLDEDLHDFESMKSYFQDLKIKFITRVKKYEFYGKTITLKLKTSDFKILTRSHSEKNVIDDEQKIIAIADELLEEYKKELKPIRLIGLTMSNRPKKDDSESNQLFLDL